MELIRKFIVVEEKGFDDNEKSLIALISTPDLDRQGEAILTNAWDVTNYLKNPVVLLGHNYSDMPVGRAMWIKRTAEGLKAKVQFASSQVGEELYKLYKEKFMNAFSVGFRPIDSVNGKDAEALVKGASTVYTKAELLEFSAVSVPANQNAVALRSLDIKSKCLKEMLKGVEDELPTEEPIEPAVQIQEPVVNTTTNAGTATVSVTVAPVEVKPDEPDEVDELMEDPKAVSEVIDQIIEETINTIKGVKHATDTCK